MDSRSPDPPAGWYDDAQQPGMRRFWDGSDWTEDRHPALAEPAPSPSIPTPAPRVCPLCGSNDMLRSIGTLIDEGTQQTQGAARTTTTGGGITTGMLSDGTLISGSTTASQTSRTTYSGTTRSVLATRFAVPPRPRRHTVAWVMLGWLGTALAAGLVFGPFVDVSDNATGPAAGHVIAIVVVFVFALAGTWIIGLVAAIVYRAVTSSAYTSRLTAWQRGCQRLRAGTYCLRDGVVVEQGVAYTPEQFRGLVFPS